MWSSQEPIVLSPTYRSKLSATTPQGDHGVARLQRITTNLSIVEGLTARSMLEAYGIQVTLAGYYHGTSTWHHLSAIGGLQIWVMDWQAAAATELLATPPPTGDANPSRSQRPRFSEIVVAAVAFLWAGLPLPLWNRRRDR